jgi:hypothetical protein
MSITACCLALVFICLLAVFIWSLCVVAGSELPLPPGA